MNNYSLYQYIDRVAKNTGDTHEILENEFFDYLVMKKYSETLKKIANNEFSNKTKIFFGNHLKNIKLDEEKYSYSILDEGFLDQPIEMLPRNCVYFLLNNDIRGSIEKYKVLFNSRQCSFFIIWDWDSQHWVEMSCNLAFFSDFYVPVSSDNAYILSHFNPFLLGPVFVGVYQWSKNFIACNMELLLRARKNTPYGPHYFYSAFPRRNRAVVTLSKKFPDINFADNTYKLTADIDNLRSWSDHKAHWIIPVRSGMPVRVFNCLITGGIPIVPSFYRSLFESTDLPRGVQFYDVIDLLEPEKLQQTANNFFDQQETAGLIQRVGNALKIYHIDSRSDMILELVKKKIYQISNS